jgi:hypothetical protein
LEGYLARIHELWQEKLAEISPVIRDTLAGQEIESLSE